MASRKLYKGQTNEFIFAKKPPGLHQGIKFRS